VVVAGVVVVVAGEVGGRLGRCQVGRR
jgi:hypothetical protein